MSIATQVTALKNVIGKLGPSRQQFATSLIHQWEKKKRLSQPQQLWVDKLIDEANAPKPEPTVVETAAELTPLLELFRKARDNKIARPRIKTYANSKELSISLAGAESVNAGMIYLKLGGEYYGKVDLHGRLVLSRNVGNLIPVAEEVPIVLRALGKDPSGFGKVHGMKYNNCCFCGRGLKTKDSVYYGYGPICAEGWGLEWGNARERIQEDKKARHAAAFQMGVAGLAALLNQQKKRD